MITRQKPEPRGYTDAAGRKTPDAPPGWPFGTTSRAQMRAEALDALCDREVTGNGVAFLALMDKQTADRWVLDSNDAKLVDGKPVILDGGKIGKPEGWKAPDLTLLV